MDSSDTITGTGEKLTDDDLAALLSQRVRLATGYSDSRLSRDRVLAQEYYDGQQPKRNHRGGSSYVTTDVRDCVNEATATLFEAFTGNHRPVQFAPNGPDDVATMQIMTEATNQAIFRQNKGAAVLHSVIKDGLMFRLGVAQAWWKESKVETDEEIRSLAPDDAQQAIMASYQANSAPFKNIKITSNDDGTVDLRYTRVEDKSQVCVQEVPPEEFGVSPRAKSLEDAEIVYRRVKKSKSDLLKDGYDKDIIEDIWTDDKVWLDTDPELIERFRETDDSSYIGLNDGLQTARDKILLYEIYTQLDMDGSGKTDLYRVVYAGNRVLDKEQVSRLPFCVYSPLKRPHSLWGDCFASFLFNVQNARSQLRRAIIEHTMITTNPRMLIVQGSLIKPSELFENRMGGAVNVTRPDGLVPLPQPSLNPYVFQLDQSLTDDGESMSGTSKLSQGLNKDAISEQNSNDMVSQLVSLSQTRIKVMARELANGFMTALFQLVAQLIIENESKKNIIEVAGNWVEVDPSQWSSERHCTVQFALGYNEQQQEAAKFASIYQALAADPSIAPGFGYAQKFNIIRQSLEAQGIKDVANYILPPNQVQPPPPDPMKQLEMQIMQREMALKERHQTLEETKQQQDMQLKAAQTELKRLRETDNVAIAKQEQTRKDAQFKHSTIVDAAEIYLQEQAQTQLSSPKPIG